MSHSVQASISSIELSKSLETLIDNVKKVLNGSNNVTVSVAWGFLQLAVAETIQTIEDHNPSLKGSSKKEIALVMIGNFYDKVFPLVTVPYLPIFIQPIIQKYTKSLLMLLIGTTIDSMVQIFRQNGVFVDPNSKVDPLIDNIPKISEK